jgi:hypothetical protein
MNLDEILVGKLADWRPAGRQTLHVAPEGAGWALTVSADRSDELGCLLWELTLRRTTPAAGDQTVKTWADRAAQRVTGLLEPLKVVEVDDLRNEALLRSREAARRGDDLFYYELLLKGTSEALLRRYRAAALPNSRREQVAFPLTHEAVAKLVGDLTADR